jgi:hypothetical protein
LGSGPKIEAEFKTLVERAKGKEYPSMLRFYCWAGDWEDVPIKHRAQAQKIYANSECWYEIGCGRIEEVYRSDFVQIS